MCLSRNLDKDPGRLSLDRLLARSLKEPILGQHFSLPGRTDRSQTIELDTSQSYIAVYTHLKVHATGMPDRLPTPECLHRADNKTDNRSTRSTKLRGDLA
ncbi:hypothetical protein KR018_010998 [Drosophila ironensis]|nr:hypothetical protein KR018_010998 [Drosophila ironensis]